MPRMTAMPTEVFFAIPILLIILIVILFFYYRALIRALVQMLRCPEAKVPQVFGFISLVPTPFTIILGLMVLIVWNRHSRWLEEYSGA